MRPPGYGRCTLHAIATYRTVRDRARIQRRKILQCAAIRAGDGHNSPRLASLRSNALAANVTTAASSQNDLPQTYAQSTSLRCQSCSTLFDSGSRRRYSHGVDAVAGEAAGHSTAESELGARSFPTLRCTAHDASRASTLAVS